MSHSSPEFPFVDAASHVPPVTPAHSLRDTAEQGVYTALLAAAGFVIIGLLRVSERLDDRRN